MNLTYARSIKPGAEREIDYARRSGKRARIRPLFPTRMDGVEAAFADLSNSIERIKAHNGEIAKANAAIAELKRSSAAADVNALEARLRILRNTQIRQEPKTDELCKNYDFAVKEKSQWRLNGKKQRHVWKATQARFWERTKRKSTDCYAALVLAFVSQKQA